MFIKKDKDFIPQSDAELRVYAVSYRDNLNKMTKDAIPHLNNAATEEHKAEVQEMIDAIEDMEKKKADLAAAVARKKELVQATTTKIRQMAMYAKKGNTGPTGKQEI